MTPAARRSGGGGGGGASCLKIAGIGCLVLALLGSIGAYLVVRNAKRIALGAARMMAVAVIEDSGMSKEQKAAFVKHVDRVIEGAKAGRISDKQLEKLMKKLAESPLIPVALVSVADARYVQPSGLTAEEKKRGKLDLQRLARGVVEKGPDGKSKISEKDVDEVTALISTTGAGGKKQLKEKLTDEEVKAFLAKVREKADAAGIPEEPYEIDPAAEFGKVIDEVLGAEGEPPEKEAPPEK